MIDLNLEHMPQPPRKKDYRIGVIGAGFIVRDVHLAAYERAGFDVRAIACADPAQAREVASARRIPRAYDTVEELLNDESLEVLDIAVPPGEQLGVMKQVVRHAGHVRGVLAQKPLSLDYARAREIVEMCEDAGIVLAVNQNMRYDQSIRACKTLLERGPFIGRQVYVPHNESSPNHANTVVLFSRGLGHVFQVEINHGGFHLEYRQACHPPATAWLA